jgi:hypothetical protein
MWKRLVKSSLLERLEKLELAADDLKIRFSFDNETILLIDEECGKEYHFLDVEAVPDYSRAGSYVYGFPSDLEYKLCFEEDEEPE